MSENTNECWGVVELMGHVTIAGKITKPGEYGGLWQIDIPEGDEFHTEFFGSHSVYRVRITSEEIARGYCTPRNDIIAYDAPIITRAEHEDAMRRAEEQYYRIQREVDELRRRLVSVNALPSGQSEDHYEDERD